jgi:hypothetical protein
MFLGSSLPRAALRAAGVLSFVLGTTLLSACPGPSGGCGHNSDCASGSYCSAGRCTRDCTPATAASDCSAGATCSAFGMCIGPSDSGATDSGPVPSDAGPSDVGLEAADAALSDAFDPRLPCVIAGGTDADGDGACAGVGLDCDDADPAINPLAVEVCTASDAPAGPRAIDENCDGAIDEGCAWHFGTPHPVLVLGSADASSTGIGTPRLSEDGLRLYVRGGAAAARPVALVLERASLDVAFGPAALVPGLSAPPVPAIGAIALSADETEAYLQIADATQHDVYRATRADRTSAFSLPVPVPELNDAVANEFHPALRRDGLEILWGSSRTGGLRLYRATRASLSSSSWSSPEELTFGGTPSDIDASPALSADGLTLFFARNLPAGWALFTAQRTSLDSTVFGTPTELTALNAAPVTIWAELSERTGEIFFVSNRPWSAGAPDQWMLWRARVCRDGPCVDEPIACASGTRSPDGLHCYEAHTTGAAWGSARDVCVGAGAHLATIHSTAENALVFEMLSSNAWLGAQRRVGGGLGDFDWVTGEPFVFLGWAAGEPSTFGELAGGYWTDGGLTRWGDWPDGSIFPYVCETETWPTW